MKIKIIILSLLFTGFLSNSHAQLSKIRIEAEWGRPKYECTGLGICGLRITIGIGTMAEGRLSSDQGTFILDVPFALTKGHEKQFSGSHFVAEEEYVLPSDLVKALGAKRQVVIRAGRHEMKKTELGYTVYFKQ